MAIFPKCEILKVSMISCSLVGIFPWEFMFDHSKTLKKIYRAFSDLMLTYYIFFVITQYIQLYCLVTSDTIRTDEISENVCLTLYYTITSTRQLIIKNGSGFQKIIEQIIESENNKSPIEDEETREIENKIIKKCQRLCKIYIFIIMGVATQYFCRPLSIADEIREFENSTVTIKHFPLSSWFPFNEQEYYEIAYAWQVCSGVIGASYVTYTDIFMFNLIIFPAGQLKKLQHFFRNFEKYKLKIKQFYGISDDDKAGQITCLDLIEKHRKLIAYIDYFNDTMGTLMVFDFIQSSIQMASILTQSIGSDKFAGIMLIVFALSFFVGMILRLYLYYYYANDIICLSEQLGSSIWASNWYEQSPRTKFLLLMIMMRCEKSLSLRIGPFSVMSVQSAISILKAAYSYIMLTVRQN